MTDTKWMLTPTQAKAIRTALGFALADPGWHPAVTDSMNTALYTLSSYSPTCRWIPLTKAQARAAAAAIGQMTDGNARDFKEWKLCTHGTYQEWLSLLCAEDKIKEAAGMLDNH